MRVATMRMMYGNEFYLLKKTEEWFVKNNKKNFHVH